MAGQERARQRAARRRPGREAVIQSDRSIFGAIERPTERPRRCAELAGDPRHARPPLEYERAQRVRDLARPPRGHGGELRRQRGEGDGMGVAVSAGQGEAEDGPREDEAGLGLPETDRAIGEPGPGAGVVRAGPHGHDLGRGDPPAGQIAHQHAGDADHRVVHLRRYRAGVGAVADDEILTRPAQIDRAAGRIGDLEGGEVAPGRPDRRGEPHERPDRAEHREVLPKPEPQPEVLATGQPRRPFEDVEERGVGNEGVGPQVGLRHASVGEHLRQRHLAEKRRELDEPRRALLCRVAAVHSAANVLKTKTRRPRRLWSRRRRASRDSGEGPGRRRRVARSSGMPHRPALLALMASVALSAASASAEDYKYQPRCRRGAPRRPVSTPASGR